MHSTNPIYNYIHNFQVSNNVLTMLLISIDNTNWFMSSFCCKILVLAFSVWSVIIFFTVIRNIQISDIALHVIVIHLRPVDIYR